MFITSLNLGVPSRVKEIPGPHYENCIQTLVQWYSQLSTCFCVFILYYRATVRQYTELAMQILRDLDFNQELMEKCLKLNSSKTAYTLFHIVADNGSGEFMQQLITVSHVSPEVVANWRYTHFLPENSAVQVDDQEISQTPLSLAIGKNNLRIIEAIHQSNEGLCTLTYINLSNVSIRAVPKEIFMFSSLKVLDLSKNKLTNLPLSNDFVNEIAIAEIDISENRLRFVPELLFSLPMLESLNIISNAVEAMPANWWRAAKLQKLDLSSNRIRAIGIEPISTIDLLMDTAPPAVHTIAASHVEFRLRQRTIIHSDTITTESSSDQSLLTVLRLNNNLLESFPRGMACITPKLESLHLVNNRIKDLCPIEELPSKLRNLDVSYNFINSRSHTIFQVGNNGYSVPCFRTSIQSPSFCSHMNHRNLCHLGNLNCGHNELNELVLFDKEQNLLFPKLFSLNLSYNRFTQLPTELHRFTELKLLTISNNPYVTEIPRDIGYINGLIEFEYNDVGDPLVGTLNGIPSIPEKLTYLRSMQQRYSS